MVGINRLNVPAIDTFSFGCGVGGIGRDRKRGGGGGRLGGNGGGGWPDPPPPMVPAAEWYQKNFLMFVVGPRIPISVLSGPCWCKDRQAQKQA